MNWWTSTKFPPCRATRLRHSTILAFQPARLRGYKLPVVSAAFSPAIELRDVSRIGEDGAAVHRVSALFERGDFHLLRGDVRAGKSLLLRLLGLMERPDRGDVLVADVPTRGLDDAARAVLRSRQCGFVFAAPFLLAGFTLLENVAMPLFKVSQVGPAEARRRSDAALDFVGLSAAAESSAAGLPLDAQFRVALARALVNEPAMVLVENLDAELAGGELREFTALLRRAAERYRTAIVATASEAMLAEAGDRVFDFVEGALRADSEILPRP